MKRISKIGLIGGDKRFYHLAELIADQKIECAVYGLDAVAGEHGFTKCLSICDSVHGADAVILPLPLLCNKNHISAPLSDNKIALDEIFEYISENALILAGSVPKYFFTYCDTHAIKNEILDYTKNEEFAIMNAISTAEGAIEHAVSLGEKTLFDSKILVCGYGRIGKYLSKLLSAFGCRIYVSARKEQDLAWIKAFGYTPLITGEISECNVPFDIIFNTVPEQILNENTLKMLSGKPSIIELASKPYGDDFKFIVLSQLLLST